MQRFPTRQNHDYRMDPNDDPIYDEYTSSGNNVTEEDRHWNFNIGTVFNFAENVIWTVWYCGIICIMWYASYFINQQEFHMKSGKAGNTNTWFNKTESDVIEEIQQVDDSNQGKCSIM